MKTTVIAFVLLCLCNLAYAQHHRDRAFDSYHRMNEAMQDAYNRMPQGPEPERRDTKPRSLTKEEIANRKRWEMISEQAELAVRLEDKPVKVWHVTSNDAKLIRHVKELTIYGKVTKVSSKCVWIALDRDWIKRDKIRVHPEYRDNQGEGWWQDSQQIDVIYRDAFRADEQRLFARWEKEAKEPKKPKPSKSHSTKTRKGTPSRPRTERIR